MKRAFIFGIARPPLSCLLATALAGCQILNSKKEKAATAANEAQSPVAESSAAAPPSQGSRPADTKPQRPADAQPNEPAAAPGDIPEFAGLPKGEAEFITVCRQLGETEKPIVSGRSGVQFSSSSLRELGANRSAQSSRHRTFVGTLAAYAARLKASGVEFVLVPVPAKEVVYPDYLPGEHALKNRRYDTYLHGIYSELERNGVRVVDVTEDLRDHRLAMAGAMYPRAALQWSPMAAEIAAQRIYKQLKRTAPVNGMAKDKTIISRVQTLSAAGETMRVRVVGTKSGNGLASLPPPAPGTAPVVLVCDANGLAYHQPNGGEPKAGLADQLAIEFGVPVETRGESNLGWTSASAKFAPGSSGAAKVVVWCLSAVDFLKDSSAPASPPLARSPRGRSQGSRASTSAPPLPAPSGSLRLRDDPGLDVRPQ
jgi:alginate O-acetyltransferase complex protein AlgJ